MMRSTMTDFGWDLPPGTPGPRMIAEDMYCPDCGATWTSDGCDHLGGWMADDPDCPTCGTHGEVGRLPLHLTP